jgi:hypothetical protein
MRHPLSKLDRHGEPEREPWICVHPRHGATETMVIEHGAVGEDAIAVLVEIARTSGGDLTASRQLQLDRLVSQGYVAIADDDNGSTDRRYKVTARGQRLLDSRGVGANEA